MITDKFEELFRVLHEASFAPPRGPLARALRSLPSEGALPSPWLTWALFGLLDLWCRRAWAWARLEKHLAPARPRRPRRPLLGGMKASGVLPGLPDWVFELDGVVGVVADRAT